MFGFFPPFFSPFSLFLGGLGWRLAWGNVGMDGVRVACFDFLPWGWRLLFFSFFFPCLCAVMLIAIPPGAYTCILRFEPISLQIIAALILEYLNI